MPHETATADRAILLPARRVGAVAYTGAHTSAQVHTNFLYAASLYGQAWS